MDRMMSIGILIAIIFLSLLLESYSMAIEKEMFNINKIISKQDLTKINPEKYIV
jgi:hypothetical protein